jgi:hypothetical protein
MSHLELLYVLLLLIVGYYILSSDLDGRGAGFRVPVGEKFSSLNVAQTGSGVQSDSYPMGTEGDFLESKAAGA